MSGLSLRKCSIERCSRLAFRSHTMCKYHVDNPPLSSLFDPPSASPTQSSPVLNSVSPNLTFEPIEGSFNLPLFALGETEKGERGLIVGRDTVSTDRIINTADLIPYEIPLDHEDGRPPPTNAFLYDDMDSAREDTSNTEQKPLQRSRSGYASINASDNSNRGNDSQDKMDQSNKDRIGVLSSSPTSPSPSTSPRDIPLHHSNCTTLHHAWALSTLQPSLRTTVSSEERDLSRPSTSRSFSSSQPINSVVEKSTNHRISLSISPRLREPVSPKGVPSTPRSVHALLDRITTLEAHGVDMIRENQELRHDLDAAKQREEHLQSELRDLQSRLCIMKQERDKDEGVIRKAPHELPPVLHSWLSGSGNVALAPSLSPSVSVPISKAEKARGAHHPQLAPLLPVASSLPSPGRSNSGSMLSNGNNHTNSPSPSASPVQSRPNSSSAIHREASPSISPSQTFVYNNNTPSFISVGATKSNMSSYRMPVKSSSNGANVDGTSMNVGNSLGSTPCIKLFNNMQSSGVAMKKLISQEDI